MTPKQHRFIEEYLIDLNATQAAIRAGYSKRNAGKIGPELLGKTRVREAIAYAIKDRSERTRVDADWVLERLVEEVEANIRDIFTHDNRLKPVHDWPDVWQKGMVKSFEEIKREDGTVVTRISFSDRLRRLELIGKHVNVQAFKDQVGSNHKVDGLLSFIETV